MKMFAMLGFNQLVRLEDYVKDMQAITHDYVFDGTSTCGRTRNTQARRGEIIF